MSDSSHEPLIVVFCCRWAGADGVAQRTNSLRLAWAPVLCAGAVSPNSVIEALTTGADGVLLTACAAQGCHYPEGEERAASRAEAIHLLLEDLGLEAARFRFELLEGGQGQLAAALNEMAAELRQLSPNPYA